MPEFLTTLGRIAETADCNGTPNWLSTHPQPENRAERVGEAVSKVRASGGEGGTLTLDRDGYLARIDGMVFGDNPEEGVVRGNLFLHPPLQDCPRIPRRMENHQQRRAGRGARAGQQSVRGDATIEPRMGCMLHQVARAHARLGHRARDLTKPPPGAWTPPSALMRAPPRGFER